MRLMEVVAFNPTGVKERKRVMLALSVPKKDEECGIGMEPIAEYRLEWIPVSVPHCVALDAPELTKATIVGCGHGFNAVALLYHFVKNGMTCPFCRAGHKGARMYWHLIPRHLRDAMRLRLDSTRANETRQQVAEDAAVALQMGGGGVSVWQGRQVLLVYAYQSPEAVSVFMTKEVVLESRRDPLSGSLSLHPFFSSMTELTRALRSAGLATTGSFEIVVATRDQHGCIVGLVRSGRFQAGDAAPVCVDAPEGTVMRVGWSEAGDMVGFDLTLQGSAMAFM